MQTTKSNQNALLIILASVVLGPVLFVSLLMILQFIFLGLSSVGLFGIVAYMEHNRSGDRPEMLGHYAPTSQRLPLCETEWESREDGVWTCDSLLGPKLPRAKTAACEVTVVDDYVTQARCDVSTRTPLDADDVEKATRRHSKNCEAQAGGWSCKDHTVTFSGLESGRRNYSVSFVDK